MANEKIKFKLPVKALVLMLIDLVILLASGVLSYSVFSHFNLPLTNWDIIVIALFALCGVLGMLLLRAYRNNYSIEYFGEAMRSFAGFLVGEIILFAACSFIDRLSIPLLMASIVAGLILLLIERIALYVVSRKIVYYINSKEYPVAFIIGAGQSGRTVLNEIKRSPDHKYRVVGFVDDDETKISTYVDGVFVFGPTMLIPELCAKYRVDELIFAIPTCTETEKDRIIKICSSTGCKIRVVPSLFDLDNKKGFLTQSSKINVEELLGRDVINLKNPLLAKFINNKTIIVTGVGSIGSELCRQIVKLGPKKLVMVDIYENNAYEIQQELVRGGYGDIISTEIASVRDADKMRSLFAKYKPQLVFHAAAHKHVPLMETNPEEAIKNNVFGTLNVARLSHEFGVDKMLLVSTDKAVNPTNVMGATKRCCEMIMQYMAQSGSETDFVAVRFGNVLGSNGSVIPLFAKQIEEGGPVTVTHRDIIRYFMTIPEAVSLILECGTLSKGGEIFVLDMGEPVKITTLAENLIRLYGYEPYTEMPIKFTGLRPGEKLFEELLMDEEGLSSTENKKIFIGKQINVEAKTFEAQLEAISAAAAANDKEKAVNLLHEIVPTFYNPNART